MATDQTDKGYVYWIKYPEMDNIWEEGYVGITTTSIDKRFKQHVYNAETYCYPLEFMEAILSEGTEVKEVATGTLKEILDIEKTYRPRKGIGWNRAQGGAWCGSRTHGLTGHYIQRSYYNMLTRVRYTTLEVEKSWLGDGGLEQFYTDVGDRPKGCVVSRKDLSLGFTKSNFLWESRANVSRKIDDCCNLLYKGEYHTYKSLGLLLGVKDNTLQYRILRGWTLDEAIAGRRKDRFVLTIDGTQVKYTGRLSDAEIEEIVELRLKSVGIIEIGNKIGVDSSVVSRLCKLLKVPSTNAASARKALND